MEEISEATALLPEATLRRMAGFWRVSVGLLAQNWASDDRERIVIGTEHLGLGLRQIRGTRSITLTEAARVPGVSISTFSRFERGLHGEGELTKLYGDDGTMTERLTLVSNLLAKLLC